MNNKIKHAIRRYFALLNMDPGVVTIRKNIYVPGDSHKRERIWINILLFAATVLTTIVAGAESDESISAIILSGLPFSMTLMAILLSHEMGHYLAAMYFNVKATLPYFIPFPSIIGTMGAIIKLKSPIFNRKALLYIGAMGPIAGFIVSLIAIIAGVYLSEIKPIPLTNDGFNICFGDSILSAFIIWAIHGNIQSGYDIYLSPYAWAGWIGFLVTGLNLMPIGQLDGSRVVYAILGRKQIYVGWIAFTGLIILSFIWPGWIVWIILSLVLLKIGHPPIEDMSELSTREKIAGYICMIIFIITFIPVPVKIF
ncbi:MAG: site-2 protease family protein [Spirochaetes bacterium]|nr:site-2 protease family protein [Spirochaetota bacterium]